MHVSLSTSLPLQVSKLRWSAISSRCSVRWASWHLTCVRWTKYANSQWSRTPCLPGPIFFSFFYFFCLGYGSIWSIPQNGQRLGLWYHYGTLLSSCSFLFSSFSPRLPVGVHHTLLDADGHWHGLGVSWHMRDLHTLWSFGVIRMQREKAVYVFAPNWWCHRCDILHDNLVKFVFMSFAGDKKKKKKEKRFENHEDWLWFDDLV